MHFTEQELQTLSTEIDAQLSELANSEEGADIQKAIRSGKKRLPKKQAAALEQATNEPAETFLKKFTHAAKQDLCVEGGMLHTQWKKYGDLENESMLKTFGGVLMGMGVTTAFMQTAVIAVSVIVLHLGIKVICADCNE